MTIEQLAKEILELSGDKSNIIDVYNCMTRLRITVKRTELVKTEPLKSLQDVLGVVEKNDEIQIILGPGKVNKVALELSKLLNKPVKSDTDVATQVKSEINKKNNTKFKNILKEIGQIFIPLIPAFIACGLIMAINNVLNIYFKDVYTASTLGKLLSVFGAGVFGALNIIVGVNAAKQWRGSIAIGGTLAAIISAPALSNIVLFDQKLVSGRGGIFSVLMVVAFAVWLEKQIRKVVPETLDLFLTPLLTILISGFVAIFLIQPLGGLISDGIGIAVATSISKGGPLIGAVMGGLFLPLVMTGLHHGLTPIHVDLIAKTGSTVLLPILAMAGAGQVGASFAVWFKTKNLKLRKTIISALPVGILGIGEPLIYGVTLPLGKPFIGACIGGAGGGAVMAMYKVGAVAIGVSGLPLTLLLQSGQVLKFLIALVTAYVIGFVATLLLGFEDPKEE